ncbi:SAC3 domain-containing protein 1 [Ostrinia nubilalis]|uniref:SAC3 domain-containing protein 1 n=1 Tax=Ostrinia nubilalis TaxID=29057 RepID=UPI00308251C8
MSYFDFFCNNIENSKPDNSEKIKGTCYSMCPQAEVTLREREKLVHVLEVVGDSRKLVKCYSRSAADSNMAVPHLLRPYSVLKDTVQYLLRDVIKRKGISSLVMYDFLNDRLRAVRQDITIQRLPAAECACLLEPMVRFYVYFGYKFINLKPGDFDQVLNKKYLLESLKWFLYCCDVIDQTSKVEEDSLNSFMSKLDINKQSPVYDRVLMESLYILCNLDDIHPLLRYIGLPKELKRNPTLELAYKTAIANWNGNYMFVCSMIEKLCPLSFCALSSYLPSIQRLGVRVMSHAYSSKQLTVPASIVRRWLYFTSDHEALSVCRHYGLKTEETRVRFNKADFKTDAPLHQLEKHLLHNEKLNLHNMEEIFITCQ